MSWANSNKKSTKHLNPSNDGQISTSDRGCYSPDEIATRFSFLLQKSYFAEEHARSGAVDLFLPFDEA